jgi:hypothetical protein
MNDANVIKVRVDFDIDNLRQKDFRVEESI